MVSYNATVKSFSRTPKKPLEAFGARNEGDNVAFQVDGDAGPLNIGCLGLVSQGVSC